MALLVEEQAQITKKRNRIMAIEPIHPEAKLKYEESLAKVVNSTGFPLQLGVKRKIEESVTQHKWIVTSMEHPWQHLESGDTGYADLILKMRCNTQIMVVECKRMLDTEWIFLCPSKSPGTPPRQWIVSKTWISYVLNKEVKKFGWDGMNIKPVGYRSEFCGIPKMDNKATTMLEKIGSELIDATESIAFQEKQLCKEGNFLRAYHPIIITTAALKVCKFSPTDINETGEITKCEFEEVPFLRFHKCLGGRLSDVSQLQDLPDVLKEHERTIHVVNSAHIVGFLRNWEYEFSGDIDIRALFG
jgi:hypothetical protein